MTQNVELFNSRLHRLKKEKAKHTLKQASFLVQEIEQVLWQRLEQLNCSFDSVLILGCPGDYLIKRVAEKCPTVVCADVAASNLIVDREALPFQKSSFNLVIDGFGLHWVNNIPQALLEVRRILTPGGIYLAGFLGEHTLRELRQVLIKTDLSLFQGAYTRVSPFLKLQTLSELLMAIGFFNPVVDHEEIKVHHPSLFDLISDLRHMGETSCLRGKYPPYKRDYFEKANEIYRASFATPQGKIETTFDCVYLLAETRSQKSDVPNQEVKVSQKAM